MENINDSGDSRASRDKKKRRSGHHHHHHHHHHPWDEEVSLPGSSEADNSTILKVLTNPLSATNNEEPDQKLSFGEHEKLGDNLNSTSATQAIETSHGESESQPSIVVSTIGDEEPFTANAIGSESLADSGFSAFTDGQDSIDSAHVLDIESHLIETYDEYADKEDSIGISELLPIQHELSAGASEIETDTNVRTIIEVEPIGVQTKQPIETVIQLDELTAKLLDTNSTGYSEEAITIPTATEQSKISEDIKEAAEILVRKIESEALEAVVQQVESHNANIKNNNNNNKNNDKQQQSIRVSEHVEKTETAARSSTIAEGDTKAEDLPTLSQRVDEQLSEVTSILKKSGNSSRHSGNAGISSNSTEKNGTPSCDQIKLVDVPSPRTALEAEERKQFIDSLPQIIESGDGNTDAQKLAIDCKREYYQSLKKYLIQSTADKPPVPLQTYRWEDLRRARDRGGYPWTHLYKRPLGPEEEPEIVLLLRKSQELRFASESPRSLKKVRIDDQVIIKETERYIQELSEDEDDQREGEGHHEETDTDDADEEDDVEKKKQEGAAEESESHSLHSECISCVSDSVLATSKPRKPYLRLANIRAIIKRRRSGRTNEDAQSLPGTLERKDKDKSKGKQVKVPRIQLPLEDSERKQEAQSGEVTPTKTPRCFPIMKKLKSMADRQKKRLQIKRVPLKKEDKIMLNDETKIIKLKKSPKSERGEIPHFVEKQDSDDVLEIVELDESPSRKRKDDAIPLHDIEPTITSSLVQPDEVIDIADIPGTADFTTSSEEVVLSSAAPPKKAPRLRREHVYEEITQAESNPVASPTATSDFQVLEMGPNVAALKESLQKQDTKTLNELESSTKPIPLDRMGSSEEEAIAASLEKTIHQTGSTLAPLSSIDSASSDEERNRMHLSPVAEESDAASCDYHLTESEIPRVVEHGAEQHSDLKPSIKKESSPAPSDKKVVTFSHVEDEAEPHREDIELPEHILEAQKKPKTQSEHDYEPIGAPSVEDTSVTATATLEQTAESNLSAAIETLRDEMKEAEELQKDLEERYFSSETTTPRTESRTDYDIHTSQVDSSALEELPLKPENRKKGFMATAQDRTRKMQAGLKNQAGRIKTKLRTSTTRKPASGSPKAKERRRFKAPEFTKMKMPEIKRPDMSKLKDFKRPEFTKFNKPDMSKFKLPEKFATLKLHRSKSLKENEAPYNDEEMIEPKSAVEGGAEPHKKLFEFNFGTYPRAFRKKKKATEPVEQASFDTGSPSVIPSTDTQPSFQSSSSPQGDRGPGPVRSRWADKFSDVSYNDSEGSRYRRYGSEQESFDRESSLERRMKDDLEDTGSEAPEVGILNRTTDNKEFAEFNEENRAIHEISNLRAGEFKRRPMVHQDSDLRSEDSRDAIGWTDKEVEKIKLLRRAELEAEASYLKSPLAETHSTASSGKKVVMEEIDDDEFFLRKRSVSEDNIELRQYISKAIREGYDVPFNALSHVGKLREPIEYTDYDVPPPKPRRLHKSFRPQDTSQELDSQRSDYGDDLSISQNGSDFFATPKRPMRKGRSRSKYSMESQDIPATSAGDDEEDLGRRGRYFDDDEEYLRPPRHLKMGMNNLDLGGKSEFEDDEERSQNLEEFPQAPRRRKRHLRDTSIEKDEKNEKDAFIKSLSGRSVSNTYLQPTEDVIVYRTEHEYYKPPLATPETYTDGGSTASHKLRLDEEEMMPDRAESMELDLRYRFKYEDETELGSTADRNTSDKFVIDITENDGYAIVRKEQLPKPTPPSRRKKFARSPGERYTSLPSSTSKMKQSTPPPERPPPPRGYTPTGYQQTAPLGGQQKVHEDDYEEPELLEMERPESPRDLQSGDIINKMKFRPLPPPPRPPREKRQRNDSKRSAHDYDDESEGHTDHLGIGESKRLAVISSDESYALSDDVDDLARLQEVEVSTQTDPLPDDFVCEEFEITDDMRVIEPRWRHSPKTLEDLLNEDQNEESSPPQLTEDEQLARGLQRFRDANQRSISEKSRASSQADRSKSQSRPQTPSAIVIERRVSTPVPSQHENETMLEASLIVRPIDDVDLDLELEAEEEALRREGLLTDSSQQSKSDVAESQSSEAIEEDIVKYDMKETSLTPSFSELERAVEDVWSLKAENRETEKVNQTERESEDDDDDMKLVERSLRKYREEMGEDEEDTARYAKEYEEDDRMKQEAGWLDDVEKKLDQAIEDIIEKHIRGDFDEGQFDEHFKDEDEEEDEEVPAPLPPPRRKSTVGNDVTSELTIVEDSPKSKTEENIAPMKETHTQLEQKPSLPGYVSDLEVDRLRVRALQAGQIMVSQLHGAQISADELECKSGNLVVKGLELPAGFIEDIVDRVRNTERHSLLTTETQTSLQASSELLAVEGASSSAQMVPPPKPPRHKDFDHLPKFQNDEQTQTELEQQQQQQQQNQHQPPPVFATTEYLENLVPLLRRDIEERHDDDNHHQSSRSRHPHRPHRHHHHHYRRCSSSSSDMNDGDGNAVKDFDSDGNYRPPSSSSRTRPPSECPSQSVSQAGRQFLSACTISLVSIMDQLTACMRSAADKNQNTDAANARRQRQVPALVVLFIVITFGVLLFLLSGRNVHTHHWDFFNPPGNEGRPS